MLALLIIEDQYLTSSVISTLIMIVSGTFLYFIGLLVMREKLLLEFFGQLKSKVQVYLKKNE